MSKLHHRALRSDEIRLVEVLPSPVGSFEDDQDVAPLELKLLIFRADKAPKYTALSYTWGNPEDVAAVSVNGAGFLITYNLYSALVQFRLDLSADEAYSAASEASQSPVSTEGGDSWPSSYIWADALCINQSDEVEKSDQVARMGSIYSDSACVMAYIGDDYHISETDSSHASASTLALSKIHAVMGRYYALVPSRSVTSIPSWAGQTFADEFCVCGDVEDDAMWTAIRDFFARPWWSRMWVMQEITSGRPTWIVYGDVRIDLRDVLIFAMLMAMAQLYPDESAFMVYGISSFVYGIKDMLDQRMPDAPEPQLLDVLMSCRHFEAADPRDKVYGALGIVPSSRSKGLIPDYSKDMVEVYTDVVLSHVRSSNYSNKLNFLAADGLPEGGMTGLPSWLPDWRHQNQYQVSFRKYFTDMSATPRQGNNRDQKYTSVYRASGSESDLKALGITPKQLVDITDRTLSVKGYRVGYLYDLQPAFQPGDTQQVISQWHASIGTEPYFTGETEMEAFSKVLVAGIEFSGHEAMCRTPLVEDKLDADSLLRSRHRFKPPPLEGVKVACTGRKLARVVQKDWTSDGLALVPESAREGDQVFVLLGGQVLYILRPIAGGYKFLGESYVHGLMDGEVLDMLKQGIEKIRDISIR